MQLAFTCQRAQGERPDHAVFPPGDETCTRRADDRATGTHASWFVKIVCVSASLGFCFWMWVLCVIICLFFLNSSGVLSSPLLSSSLSSLGEVTLNTTPQPHQAVSNNKAEAVKLMNNKCAECQTQFCSKEEMAEHFQEIKPAHTTVSLVYVRKKDRNYILMECSMSVYWLTFFFLLFSSHAQSVLLPCSCQTRAVQQLINASTKTAHHMFAQSVEPQSSCRCFRHIWMRPVCTLHVASDTGAIPGCVNRKKLYWWYTLLLFSYFCLPLSRCSSCQVVFGGLNSVKSHIQQAHCDMFHKCPSCPMAFKSSLSIQSHIAAQHPALTEGQTMYYTHTYTQNLKFFNLIINFSLKINWSNFYLFTDWYINVSCVTLFLPRGPCCMPTLTLI